MTISPEAQFARTDPASDAGVLIERARALRSQLREEQEATEERGAYSPQMHEAFVEAGFYKILQPRMYGGYELDIATFTKVVVEIARGCPSTGWCLCLAAGHHLVMGGFYGQAAQDAVYEGGHFAAPYRPVPMGTATRVDGGWVVNGEWDYCSGSPYSTHALLGVRILGEDAPAAVGTVIVPRADWNLLDNWRNSVMGMRGSGSNSIRLEDALIPDEFLAPGSVLDPQVGHDSPGYQLHPSPLYTGVTLGFGALEVCAVLVGTARAAADEYERILREKKTLGPNPRPRYESHDYQRWYAEAIAKIDAAEELMVSAANTFTACCQQAVDDPDGDWSVNIARMDMTTHLVTFQLAWEAVELLFSTSGSSEGPRQGSRIQRYYRDFSMGRTNVFPRTVPAWRSFVISHFGLDDVVTF